MWRTRDGSSKYLSRTIGRSFNSVVFSPDGQYVAAGNGDQHLRVWAARTGHLVRKWEGHAHVVWSVVFRPDGKRLASGGGYPDYVWRCWDVSSLHGQLLTSEHTVNDEVEKEAFTGEGHTVRFFLSCHTFR
jgi:WD40 repeat protein